MKIIQIVKKLNNTELGKGGTHDTYVLIPNDLDVTDVFEQNVPMNFVDKHSGEIVTVRNTVGREKRIVGLGQYYRNMNLSAGDEIIFEKKEGIDETKLIIYTKRYDDSIVIQKYKHGFEILTPERTERFKEILSVMDIDIQIEFKVSERKRNDSPEVTDFYDVKINGDSLLNKFSGKELVELSVLDNKVTISSFYGWKKYIFEVEE